MSRIRRNRVAGLLPILALALVLILLSGALVSAGGPVVHRVTVGSPDLCPAFDLRPGCDKNLSLTAIQDADGSVKGQYTDRWGDVVSSGAIGFHAVITCVSVVGNEAWISGVITQGRTGPGGVYDLAGLRVGIRVRDNGTSANDPADQTSWSYLDAPGNPPFQPCTEHPDYPLVDLVQGQVVVK